MTDKLRVLRVHQSDPTCLARFKAERIDGVDSVSEAALVGTACHRACEALAYELEDVEDEPSPDELFAVARREIETASLEARGSGDVAEKAIAIMSRAIYPPSRIRFGRPTGWTSGAEVLWGLDRNFKPCDPDSPDAIAGGTIDLLMWDDPSGKVVVRDWKTTLGFQKADEIGWAWQPRLYCLWAIQNYGVRRVTFEYVNLRHGYTVRAEFHRDEPWYEATKARVLALRAEREVAVEMDTWPETMGDNCGFCPVKHACAAWRVAAAQGKVIPADMPPGEIGRRALALRALASAYEEAAEEIVDATEAPIDLGNGIGLGARPATKWRLIPRFANDDGSVTQEQRAALMDYLRGLRMTPEQEFEWFGFVRTSDLPGAVKSAIGELLGREARRLLDDESATPLEQSTRYEFGTWLPLEGKRVRGEALEDTVGDPFADEIDELRKSDPERLRRALADLK